LIDASHSLKYLLVSKVSILIFLNIIIKDLINIIYFAISAVMPYEKLLTFLIITNMLENTSYKRTLMVIKRSLYRLYNTF